jgi:hypothetical protein
MTGPQRLAISASIVLAALWAQSQPINFSHKTHAGDHKIDCLFCHSGARRSPVAGIPSVQFCMGCHRMAAATRPEIQRVAAHLEKNQPIRWARVVKQPDYVFFNHAPHVAKGFRCQECHGPVETMDNVRLDHTLSMDVCVKCHRRESASLDCYTCHR